MEDIIAIIMFGGGGAMFLLAISPVGRAIADRIRRAAPADIEAELYAEMDGLRADVSDLQERLDFAERLLSEQREQGQIANRSSGGDGFTE
jgi:hypothetical protein